ncbi:hypothetical protein Dimus_029204 [Dionaea muscipula]
MRSAYRTTSSSSPRYFLAIPLRTSAQCRDRRCHAACNAPPAVRARASDRTPNGRRNRVEGVNIMDRAIVSGALAAMLALTPFYAEAQTTTTTGSVGCATLVQAAANGMTARMAADQATIQQPKSVTSLTCLGNFFNGIGLNLVTNLLNPAFCCKPWKARSAPLSNRPGIPGSARCSAA